MERSHLKGWKDFKANSERVLPHIERLIQENPHDLPGLLCTLRALSACKFTAAKIRDQIIDSILQMENFKDKGITNEAIVDALVGLASC